MTTPESPPEPDPYTEAVTSPAYVTRVWGAPGTGKTTVAVQRVAYLVEQGLHPDAVSLWCAARASAGRTRVALSQLIGKASSTRQACTPASFAFALVRRAEAAAGDSGVRLLSGPEQDVLLADLVQGHAEGVGACPAWPTHLEQALPTRTFRQELRETLMRLIEIGASPDDVHEAAALTGSDVWGPLATMMDEYLNVSQWRWPNAVDPSALLVMAASAIHENPELLHAAGSGVRMSHVVVDDAQELTEAGLMLVQTLASQGVHLTLCGDPDVTVNTFRGATRGGFAAVRPPAFAAEVDVVLPYTFGVEPEIAQVVAALSQRVGVAASARHRGPQVWDAPCHPERTELQTEATAALHHAPWQVLRPVPVVAVGTAVRGAQEVTGVVRWLTDIHDSTGCAWHELCVVVRGRADTAALRRELAAHHIPVATGGVETALRDEPVVAALLSCIEAGQLLLVDEPDPLLPDALTELLTSPLIGGTRADARRIRMAVRRSAAASYPEDPHGVSRLWRDVVEGAAHTRGLTSSQPMLLRLATTVRATARVLRLRGGAQAIIPAGASVEDVLWAAWEAAARAPEWQHTALVGGPGAGSAHQHLDAAMGLFAAARRFAERLPQHTVRAFLEHVRAQDLAEDRLSGTVTGGGLTITTAAGAAGRRWAGVAVMGVTEGRWPNTRVRTGLLQGDHLVASLLGRPAATIDSRTQVIHDETRMFVAAISRATRWLLVTAVDGEDARPSTLHAAVASAPGAQTYDLSVPPWTMPMVVADARSGWTHLHGGTRAQAYPPARWFTQSTADDVAAVIARAVHLGVRSAHPRSWWGASVPTPTASAEKTEVRVSPSALEKFVGCPRRWFLEAHGGATADSGVRADLGTLIHYVTETADLNSCADATQVLQRWWHTLASPAGWTRDALLKEANMMVQHAVSYHSAAAAEGWELVANEQWLRVPFDDAVTLTGRIDRLERNPYGALRVIDFKTGSPQNVEDPATNPQLGLYQVGVERGGVGEHGTSSAGASLVFLSQKTTSRNFVRTQPPLTQHPNPSWAEELIAHAATGMRGPTFPAQPATTRCQTCSFRRGCPGQSHNNSGENA